jgi:hypothetical protein
MQSFRVPPDVHGRAFHGEMVLLHLGAGAYFSLDPVGSIIWEELSAGKTLDDAVARVLADFDVDETTARVDAKRLVDELMAAGLLATA